MEEGEELRITAARITCIAGNADKASRWRATLAVDDADVTGGVYTVQGYGHTLEAALVSAVRSFARYTFPREEREGQTA